MKKENLEIVCHYCTLDGFLRRMGSLKGQKLISEGYDIDESKLGAETTTEFFSVVQNEGGRNVSRKV